MSSLIFILSSNFISLNKFPLNTLLHNEPTNNLPVIKHLNASFLSCIVIFPVPLTNLTPSLDILLYPQ